MTFYYYNILKHSCSSRMNIYEHNFAHKCSSVNPDQDLFHLKINLFSLKCLIILFLLIVSCFNTNGQSFRFRNYDSNMGLPQNFVYCVEQGSDGFLWIGTGEGLVKYDGIKFQTLSTRDSLADDFITSLFLASNGNIWAGHNNGHITIISHDNKPLRIPESNSPLRHLCQDNNENIWGVVQNNGPVKIGKNNKITTYFDTNKLGYKLFYSVYPLSDNTILLGTSEGLMKVTLGNNDEIIGVEKLDGIPPTIITTITPRKGIKGEFWIGTEDEGFFRYSMDNTKANQIIDNRLCLSFNIQNENIQDIYEEDEGHLLIGTWGNGVIKLFFDPLLQDFSDSFTFSTINGLSNNFIKNILCDREGNYWFATYGGGISALLDESMVFYNLNTIGFQDNKSHSVYKTDKFLLIGLENGFIKTDPYCFTNFEFFDKEMGIPKDEITGFYESPDGKIWITTGNNGLFYLDTNTNTIKPYFYTPSLTGKKIRGIIGDGETIFLATVGGYFEINLKTRAILHLTTESGLPHNNINFIYRDNNKQIWIGPKNSGICRIDHTRIEVHKISQTPVDVYGMAEDNNGNRWLATHGKGILKYSEDTLENITVTEGLGKNFCYSIIIDKTNKLWVTHFPGLSCVDLLTGKIKTFGFEENLGADFYSSHEDKDGNVWFASNQGVINYFPEKNMENKIAPNLNFTVIKISGITQSIRNKIELPYPYSNKYKFWFEFIGISFKNPKGVRYQYQLEKFGEQSDGEWIDLPTTWWERDYLPDGDWILKIRSFNADGIVNTDPLNLRIQIASPIWKKGWFYLLILSGLVYTIYLIINVREKKLRYQKEQLQREVASQTIVLRQQKAEIERKNRDITDSINYAKKIQSSILPSIEALEKKFKESFIFFVPRDIVSGDFYWLHETKGKFRFCCADCTGHGVPGAFMSMIGTTLLNDIVKRDDINSPADILNRLDFEIKILLQKNSKDTTQDGMDISIVEVELDTKKIRVASARRPVYIFLNNELTIYKGVRRSIGDAIIDDSNPFVNIEYNGKPDDVIYLFSDGYTDQFGGIKGKKFMTVAVRELLEKIHHKPMKEQSRIIRDTFYNWKDDLEQVDDVIFMGVKL